MEDIKLSGVVITFNEEEKIERCIRSLFMVCDEVVVLDSYSQDKTRKIAENLGAKIFQHSFDGHIQQKNRAITMAASPYILSLDADEELSNELIESIKNVKQNWQYDGYTMNRLNNYNGHWIRHGSWYPDKKLRLWDSRMGKWGGENPHDKFILNSGTSMIHLKGNILHYTMNDFSDLKNQTIKFSTIAAKSMFEKNKRIGKFEILAKTIFRFIKEYFFLAGFLDGKAGFEIAIMNAWYVWLKYSKLNKLYRAS